VFAAVPYDPLHDIEFAARRRIRTRALKVPEVSPREVCPGGVTLSFVDLVGTNGNTTLFEQALILSVARAAGARTVFEFGTFDGRTSANLALNLGDGAHILTIDLPAKDADHAALPIGREDLTFLIKDEIGAKSRENPGITQLYGDTATFDFSPWYGTCDLVFVDACHEYEYVKKDSETALALVRRGGTILWHDYGEWLGVTKALNELLASEPRLRQIRHISKTSLCICVCA
jgi:hypothetical protein